MKRTSGMENLKQHACAIVGMGCICSWAYATFFSAALSPQGFLLPGNFNLFWNVSMVALTATLGLFVVLPKVLALPAHYARFVVSSSLLVSMGSAAMSLSSGSSSGILVLLGCLGAIVAGVGNAVLYVAAGMRIAELRRCPVDFSVVLAFFVAMAISLLAAWVPRPFPTVISCLVPLACAFLMWEDRLLGKTRSLQAPDDTATGTEYVGGGKKPALSKSSYVCSGLLISLFWLCFSILQQMSMGGSAQEASHSLTPVLLAGWVTTVVFLAVFLWFSRRLTFILVFQYSAPVLSFSFLLACVLPVDLRTIPYVLSFSAMMSLNVFVWVVGVQIARAADTKASAIKAISGLRFFVYLGSCASATLGFIYKMLDAQTIAVVVVCLMFVVVIALFPIIIRHDRTELSERSEKSMLDERPERAVTEGDSADLSFSRFCSRYGLTKREEEIAYLLTKGRDVSFIKDAFFISRNTVNTHIRHIYRKVGVNSKQGLLDAIENFAQS